MLSTLPPAPAAVDGTLKPGQLFNAEDFSLADLPPTEVWDRVVTIAVREHASDIHLCCQRDGMHVALRMDGRVYPQGVVPAELGARLAGHTKSTWTFPKSRCSIPNRKPESDSSARHNAVAWPQSALVVPFPP